MQCMLALPGFDVDTEGSAWRHRIYFHFLIFDPYVNTPQTPGRWGEYPMGRTVCAERLGRD